MNFILTLDYELFGDGSGDIFELMIKPTEKILKICDKYDVKITIFFEVVEYWKLKQEWDNGNKMGYQNNPISAIENQLQEAAKNGHDIQLHIHPQWIGAEYKNNGWKVDFSNWRLGNFKANEQYTIEKLLTEGKKAIEKLIQPILPKYKCIALRAGGYNIMPSTDVFSAMKKSGLSIDSSIFPGGYENGKLSNYDYKNVKNDLDYWWGNEKNIAKQSSEQCEILELPIFALEQRRWKKFFNLHRVMMMMGDKQPVSSLTKAKMSNKAWINKIAYFFEKEVMTWDYCLFNVMLNNRFFSFIDKQLPENRKYFVLVGHSKNSYNKKGINKLFKKIKERNGRFLTISEFEKEILLEPSKVLNEV